MRCREKVTHAQRLIELGALKRPPAATTIISALGRCGEVRRAWDAFEQVQSPNAFIYSAMISACEKARGRAEWKRALELLATSLEATETFDPNRNPTEALEAAKAEVG